MRLKYMQCALLLSILVLNLFILGRSKEPGQNGNGGRNKPTSNNEADTTQAPIPKDPERALELEIMMMLASDKNGLKKTEKFIKLLKALLNIWDAPNTMGTSTTESTTLSTESDATTPPSNTTNATSVTTTTPTEAKAQDTKPVAPDAEAVVPGAEAVVPGAEPVAPGAEPVAPGAEPVAPGAGPVAPGAEPVAPGAGPVAPGAEPVAPGAEPVTPGAKNMAQDIEKTLAGTNAPIAPFVPTKHFYQTSVFSFFLFCSFFTIIALFFCYISRRKIKVYFYKNFNGGRNGKGPTRAPTLEDAMPSFTDVKN